MRWLGLYLPRLALDVFQRHLAGPTALAVGRHGRILCVDAPAAAAGIRPGQRQVTALALLPTLTVLERAVATEQQALCRLADWAQQFTPRVYRQDPDEGEPAAGLLLDIEASLRLFGGLHRLRACIVTGSQALGFAVRSGCGPTPRAAWLLARWQDGQTIAEPAAIAEGLARMPVRLLATMQSRTARDTARTIGLHGFADLLQLPRSGLARRFGKPLLTEIDQTLGQQADLRDSHQPPAQFDSHLELLADQIQIEALLHGLRPLLLELAGWLQARQAGARAVLIQAEHDRLRRGTAPPSTRIDIRFASPTTDVERMLGLVRERLARTPLPAPVHTLRVRCDAPVALESSSNGLFPGQQSTEEQLARLVERLQARLGSDQIQWIRLSADHRPESAYRISAAPMAVAAPVGGLSPLLSRVARPLWLLQRPEPLPERNQRPWRDGPLRLISGPERIEGGWWDEGLIQRDYFIAEDTLARWLWIYRIRGQPQPGCPAETGRHWFLQGMFG